jgi:translation initiation factor 1
MAGLFLFDNIFHIFYTIQDMKKNNACIVWSSSEGDKRKKESRFVNTKSVPPQQQIVYLHRESGGRGGKVVSIVKNLALSNDDMKSLAKKLKRECGTGGTVKDGMIEIQGEHRQRIADALQKLGYTVQIAGG